MAHECDRCGAFYKPVPGCVTIETIYVTSKEKYKGDHMDDSWSGIDFCPKCSKVVLGAIGPALNGLAEALRARPKRSSGT